MSIVGMNKRKKKWKIQTRNLSIPKCDDHYELNARHIYTKLLMQSGKQNRRERKCIMDNNIFLLLLLFI